jgi:hypothetical protein
VAITPFNITQGPAFLYWGQFGTTEPADSTVGAGTAPGAGWTDVGGIMDGTSVLLEIDLTYTDQGVDQLPISTGARLTKHVATVTASLEETTLANLSLAMNQLATTSVQSNYTTLEPIVASSSTQPSYTALVIDAQAPTLNTGIAAKRRIILRKTLSQSKIAQESEKSKPAVYTCTWTCYYVSAGVQPWHICDQTG